MADESEISGVELGRWLIIGILILGCLGLYVWLAPQTPAALRPVEVEAGP